MQAPGFEDQPSGSKAGTQAAVPLGQSADSSGQGGVQCVLPSAASAAAKAQAPAIAPEKPSDSMQMRGLGQHSPDVRKRCKEGEASVESTEALLNGAGPESAEADTLAYAALQVTDEPTAVKQTPVEALLPGQGSNSASDEAEGLPASAGNAGAVSAEEQPSAENPSDQLAVGQKLSTAPLLPGQGNTLASDEAEGLPVSAGNADAVPAAGQQPSAAPLLPVQGSTLASDEAEGLPASAGSADAVPAAGQQPSAAPLLPVQGSTLASDEAEGLPANDGDADAVPAAGQQPSAATLLPVHNSTLW